MFSGSYSKPSSRKERAKRSAAKIPVATPTVAAGLLNSCLRFAVTDSPAVHQFGQASNAGLWHLTCQLGLQHFPPPEGLRWSLSHPGFCTKLVTNKASPRGALKKGGFPHRSGLFCLAHQLCQAGSAVAAKGGSHWAMSYGFPPSKRSNRVKGCQGGMVKDRFGILVGATCV